MTPQCIWGIQVLIYTELVAASSRPMVLSILTGGESYGYEILKQVKLLDQPAGRVSWRAIGQAGWPCTGRSKRRGEAVMFDMKKAVTRWRKDLERKSSLSTDKMDELEDHLRTQVDLEMRLSPGLEPARALAAAREKLGEAGTLSKEFTKGGTPAWLYGMRVAWVMFAVSFVCPIAETTTVAGAGYSTRGDPEIWTTVFGWERFFVAPFNSAGVYPVLSLLTNLLMLSTLFHRRWLPVARWPLFLMVGAGVLNMQWADDLLLLGVDLGRGRITTRCSAAHFGVRRSIAAALALFIRKGELKSTNSGRAPA